MSQFKIDHVAVWTRQLDELKSFYCTWFEAVAGDLYENPATGFRSYFLKFGEICRLEIMNKPGILDRDGSRENGEVGFVHLAISVGGEQEVRALTERMRAAGVPVVGEPRTTGDGYFESCVLDPDGNRIEITS